VLSLSPGAAHAASKRFCALREPIQVMASMADDFWDNWKEIHGHDELC